MLAAREARARRSICGRARGHSGGHCRRDRAAGSLGSHAIFWWQLTWAAVIAITCWPIYLRFERLVGHRSRSLAPLLFTLVTGLVLLVPIIVTVHQLAQGSEAFVRALNRLRESGIAVPAWLAQLPVAG